VRGAINAQFNEMAGSIISLGECIEATPPRFQVEAKRPSGIAEWAMCGIGSFEICAWAGFEMGAGDAAEFLGFPIVGWLAAPGARKADFVAGDTKSWRGTCGAGAEHAGEQVIACGADVLYA
jgi:hypothetical protein